MLFIQLYLCNLYFIINRIHFFKLQEPEKNSNNKFEVKSRSQSITAESSESIRILKYKWFPSITLYHNHVHHSPSSIRTIGDVDEPIISRLNVLIRRVFKIFSLIIYIKAIGSPILESARSQFFILFLGDFSGQFFGFWRVFLDATSAFLKDEMYPISISIWNNCTIST